MSHLYVIVVAGIAVRSVVFFYLYNALASVTNLDLVSFPFSFVASALAVIVCRSIGLDRMP